MYHENLSIIIPRDRPNLNQLDVAMCIQGTENCKLLTNVYKYFYGNCPENLRDLHILHEPKCYLNSASVNGIHVVSKTILSL